MTDTDRKRYEALHDLVHYRNWERLESWDPVRDWEAYGAAWERVRGPAQDRLSIIIGAIKVTA